MNEKIEMITRIQKMIDKDSKNKSQILRELHLSTSTLSDWEKGKGNPSTSAIIKLAKYFNVTSDYLLFGTEKEGNSELTASENKWLQIYYTFSESEKEDLLTIMDTASGRRDLAVFLNGLKQLSRQERELCFAFIHGVIAEKKLNEGL